MTDPKVMEVVGRLDRIADSLMRSGMRLHGRARVIAAKGICNRVTATLQRYVNQDGKYAVDEVREALAMLESAMPEKKRRELEKGRAERKAKQEDRERRRPERERQWWSPGGVEFENVERQIANDAEMLAETVALLGRRIVDDRLRERLKHYAENRYEIAYLVLAARKPVEKADRRKKQPPPPVPENIVPLFGRSP